MKRTKCQILNSVIPAEGRNITSREAKALRKMGHRCSSKSGIWSIQRRDSKGLIGFLFRKGKATYIKVSVRKKYIAEAFPKKVRTGVLRVYRPVDFRKDINLPEFLRTPYGGSENVCRW